jgi:hypothetical protein
MVARVISFRVDDDVLSKLEERKLRDESVMLTAQRILSEALGIIKSPDYVSVAELVDTALIPIQEKLESEIRELRSRLDALETRRTESLPNTPPQNLETSQLVERLGELLDTKEYPTNNAGKLRKRLSEIISEIK